MDSHLTNCLYLAVHMSVFKNVALDFSGHLQVCQSFASCLQDNEERLSDRR